MTRTALENKKLEQEDRHFKEDQRFRRDENKKDRIVKGVTGIFGPTIKAASALRPGSMMSRITRQDPEWYKQYLHDLDKFTNVATYHRLGTTNLRAVNKTASTRLAIPALAVAHLVPTIGPSYGEDTVLSQSSINQILMRTKEQVLKSNSRSSVPYEASDLGLNLIATTSIVEMIAEAERALYAAQTYRARNAYFASTILTQLGWEASSVLDHLPQFRQYISQILRRFNSACVTPQEFALRKRWQYLGSVILKDSETEPYQMMAYVFDYYYRLNADGSGLDAVHRPGLYTPLKWYNAVSDAIQRLSENPDFQSMYADLRSAMDGRLLELEEIVSENGSIEPTYDPSFREQWANLETVPAFFESGDGEFFGIPFIDTQLAITQNSAGFLRQGTVGKGLVSTLELPDYKAGAARTLLPAKVAAYHGPDSQKSMNLHKDDVTGDDILDSTRFNVTVVAESSPDPNSPTFTFTLTDYGTEIVADIQTTRMGSNGSLISQYIYTSYFTDSSTSYIGDRYFLESFSDVTAFDWFPMVELHDISNAGLRDYYFSEFTHPFDMDRKTLKNLNDACLLSLFYLDTDVFKR